MSLPTMSPEDRAKALESAKQSRSRRAAILRQVTSGELSVAAVVDGYQENEDYARIKVTALLKAVPGYGDVRVSRLMKELGIAESRRVRGLGFKQRAALKEHFASEG